MLTKDQQNLFGDIFAGLVSVYNTNFTSINYEYIMERYKLHSGEVDQVISKANGNSSILTNCLTDQKK